MLRPLTAQPSFAPNISQTNKINKGQTPEQNEKLSQISKQIADGKYEINLEKLARKIADELS